MSHLWFSMAIGTSIFNFGKRLKPYKDDHIFVDEDMEIFLRGLSWDTELIEFKNINKVILRQKNNRRNLYTILKRDDKGFSLYRIAKYIIRNNPNNIPFDISNVVLQKYGDKLYFTYSAIN